MYNLDLRLPLQFYLWCVHWVLVSSLRIFKFSLKTFNYQQRVNKEWYTWPSCCVGMASPKYSYFSVVPALYLCVWVDTRNLQLNRYKEFASTRPCQFLYKNKYEELLVILSPSFSLLMMMIETITCYSKGGK